MRKILTIGWKDVRVVLRDKPALMVLLGMPVVLILILSSALGGIGSGDFRAVPVAVVDHDGSEVSREVTDVLLDRKKLGELIDANATSDEDAAREQVRMGELAAVLVIPEDFGEKLGRGEQATMKVETDPGEPMSASIFTSVVEALTSRLSAAVVTAKTTSKVIEESRLARSEADAHTYVEAAVDAAVADSLESVRVVRQRKAAGDDNGFDAISYYGAGMAVMFLNFGAMFGAFALLRERTEDTLGRMLTAPLSRVQVVAGKALGVFAIGLLQFVVLYLVGTAMGAKWGSAASVFAVAASQLLAVTGLAMTIAAVGKTQRGAGGIGPLIILLMAAAGGSWMPVSQMPEAIRPIHFFTINGWSLDAMLHIQDGGALAGVLPNMGALAVIGIVLFAFGAWRLRWER